jgi:hypothetical protein
MKTTFYIIAAFALASLQSYAQFNAQSKKITEKFFPENNSIDNVTPALKKSKGFTDYEELISFLNDLKAKHPSLVEINYIGESQKGNRIPLMHIRNSSTSDKIKVWIQGGLHGNEPASSEGVLYVLNEILNKPENHYLLDRIELAVVPMANIDGYLKQNRYAANGLDLNRDQTKLMAPESVVLKQAYSNFNPEVGLDFHEYNPFRKDFTKLSSFGITSYFDVMFLYSGNLNVPKNLRTLTDSVFVQNARKVLDANNLSHNDYVSTTNHSGEIYFKQGSISARSSATSYALTNTVSTLVEVRGVGLDRTSFKRRINTTCLIAMSYLKTSYQNSKLIKQEIQKAQDKTYEIIVSSLGAVTKEKLKVIDVDSNNLIDLEVAISNSMKAKPKLVRALPEAYIILENQDEIIKKLEILGINVQKISQDITYLVESFMVSSFDDNGLEYEKMKLQKVETNIETKEVKFPIGTYYISTKQKNAPLLTEVLEPEADNSFVSFGVLKTKLNQELPIYRLPKKNQN